MRGSSPAVGLAKAVRDRRIQRRVVALGVAVAVAVAPAVGRADDEPPETADRLKPAPPAAPPRSPPPPSSLPPTDAILPSSLAVGTPAPVVPPQQPAAVPNPSPVVIAGVPTPPGTALPPLTWKRRRFGTADYVITGAGGALTLAAAIVRPRPTGVTGPVLFDNEFRSLVRGSSLQVRYSFRDASDVGLSLAVTWPFFVDALASAWWLRGSRDVAEQMALVDLETFAIAGALQGVTNVFVGRERPYGSTCGAGLPPDAYDCSGSTHYRSFFSGHSAFSFTGAALVCFHHFEQELLGAPWDALSCGLGYGVAASTAIFRSVADVHYASDIVTGALMGTVIGYGVPLMHFRMPAVGDPKRQGFTMKIVPQAMGAGVVGMF